MPCYLFTFHAYGSWMPDRKRGFVRRGKGLTSPNAKLAKVYRDSQTQSTVEFDEQLQQQLIDAAINAATAQDFRLHSIATDSSHVHILVSWRGEKDWMLVRRGLRRSLTLHLNEKYESRDWFAKSGSRKQVLDRKHFDHLVTRYLPNHRGRKWSENDREESAKEEAE